MMFTIPDFPEPVVPPIRMLRRSIQISALRPSSKSPSPAGWTIEVFSVPGQVISAACGSVSITRKMNASARESSGKTRTLPRRTPRPDSMAGIFAMASSALVPFRRITRAVHPHASATTETIREPARPAGPATSGHAAMVRSTRTRARRRRCIHHGIPRIAVLIAAACGSGLTVGPIAIAAASHPPVAATTQAA